MSLIVKDPLPSDNPNYAYASKTADSIKRNATIRSFDFNTTSHVGGTHLSLHPKYKYNQNYTHYAGDWNSTSSYAPGDIVRVLPRQNWTPNNLYPWVGTPTEVTINPPSTGLTANTKFLTGQVVIDGIQYNVTVPKYLPIPGTYVCIYPIPAFSTYFQIGRLFNNPYQGVEAGHFPVSHYSEFVQKNIRFIRFVNVNYFPVWPEMSNAAYLNGNDIFSLFGRYWDLISLLPTETHVCSNGIDSVEWTDTQTVPSGSANFTG